MTWKAMRLIDPQRSEFECKVCGSVHCGAIKPNSAGHFYRGTWQCQNGCTREDYEERKKAELGEPAAWTACNQSNKTSRSPGRSTGQPWKALIRFKRSWQKQRWRPVHGSWLTGDAITATLENSRSNDWNDAPWRSGRDPGLVQEKLLDTRWFTWKN